MYNICTNRLNRTVTVLFYDTLIRLPILFSGRCKPLHEGPSARAAQSQNQTTCHCVPL